LEKLQQHAADVSSDSQRSLEYGPEVTDSTFFSLS